MLSHWETYALAIAGVLGFVLQQVSLGTGRLAPSVATVSVANPVVCVLIGDAAPRRAARAARLARRASRSSASALALAGAVVISLARETMTSRGGAPDPGEPSVAIA